MLRGINVSGHKKIRMEELRGQYEALNLSNIETYVQSGNVVFDSTESDPTILAESIKAQIHKSFGYTVPVFIRDSYDFKRIINSNPFLIERNEDPARLAVIFLQGVPEKSKLDLLVVPKNETAEYLLQEALH